MWPLFIGMQVVKTVLLVLFLPGIIGSVGQYCNIIINREIEAIK